MTDLTIDDAVNIVFGDAQDSLELSAKKAEEMNLKTLQQLGSYDPALKEKFKNDPAKLSIVTALEDAQNIGAFGRFVKDVSQSWGLGVAISEMADLNFKQFIGQELDAVQENNLKRTNKIQESKINYGGSLYGIPQAVAETAPLMLDAVASKEAILGLYISVLLVISIKGLSKWKKWLILGYLSGFFCKTIQFIVYFSIK